MLLYEKMSLMYLFIYFFSVKHLVQPILQKSQMVLVPSQLLQLGSVRI